MHTLSPLTCARLKRLPKHPVVWEGDRRPISEGMLDAFGYAEGDGNEGGASDCILWVDGSEGVLRAVTIIPADTGHEAVVRTLLQAMEHPQGAVSAARPQKIVVCDREVHFFLRGALQDLDVVVDYAEDLPIIDEIFESLQQPDNESESSLPAGWQEDLNHLAKQIWDTAPWNALGDDQIFKIAVNHWNLEDLYVSVLGMAGLEYGLLIYRSLDSLTQFRQTAMLDGLSPQQMQQAFLSQDCLFLNFDLVREENDSPLLPLPWMQTAPSEVIPEFGSLHPLEGLRNALELEEAAALKVCLEGLNRFFLEYEAQLSGADFPDLQSSYTLSDPVANTPVEITISSCPMVTAQIAVSEGFDTPERQQALANLPRLRDDYVPEGAIILLTRLPRAVMQSIRQDKQYAAIATPSPDLEMLPVVVVQTSRPKAQKLVTQLQAAGGVEAVCFNPGGDPMTGDVLQLGLLKTGDGDFHLFIELLESDPHDNRLFQKWQEWKESAQGVCGVMVASGVTGAARGNPGPKENVAFFETHLRNPEELNLPPLQMSYALDWE